ncbi:unnamed protein product, partial [Mesorhabditis spiculigera]
MPRPRRAAAEEARRINAPNHPPPTRRSARAPNNQLADDSDIMEIFSGDEDDELSPGGSSEDDSFISDNDDVLDLDDDTAADSVLAAVIEASLDDYVMQSPRRRAVLDDTLANDDSDVREDVNASTSSGEAPARVVIVSDDESVHSDDGPRPPKRAKTESPKKAKVEVFDDGDGDDGCTICFDSYTTNGDHRLVSLKCGHFYGKSCIERWIRGEKAPHCPQCKAKAGIKDIRTHYARTVQITDNSELESTKKSRDEYKRMVTSLELDVARHLNTIRELEEKLTKAPSAAAVTAFQVYKFKLAVGNKLAMSCDGCRAIDFDDQFVYIGYNRKGALFSGYSLQILDMRLKRGPNSPLHTGKIRQFAICPSLTTRLLSVGEDNTAVIYDLQTSQKVKTFRLDTPGWTCCWLSDTECAIGLRNGRVFKYDVTAASDQRPVDLTGGDGPFPIHHLSYFDKFSLLLIGSMRRVLGYYRGATIPLLDNAKDNFQKISAVASDPSSQKILVVLPDGDGQRPIEHRLYHIREEGPTVRHFF